MHGPGPHAPSASGQKRTPKARVGIENLERSGSTFCGSTVGHPGSRTRKYGTRSFPWNWMATANAQPVRNENRVLAPRIVIASKWNPILSHRLQQLQNPVHFILGIVEMWAKSQIMIPLPIL